MSLIDVFIPLCAGIVMTAFPQFLAKPESPDFEKKKRLFRKLGFVLLGVSALYFVLMLVSGPTRP